MPIEEVSLSQNDNIPLSSKLLLREEFWYTQLCCIYPYGLNDNVRQFGNVSKRIGRSLVVYSLFNKQKRKYDRGRRRRKKHNVDVNVRKLQFIELLNTYLLPTFCFNL